MPRNIMAALNATPDGGAPQHAFDLSAFSDFHQKGGQFNVVGVRDTVPNSVYRMGVDGFTRSMLCNTANFCHIKENYYFIHVPLALLSRNAYQTLVNRKQAYSALDMDITGFPVFPLATVVNRLLEITQMHGAQLLAKFQDIHGFNIAYGAIKLLDMLGYGYFGDLVNAIDGEVLTLAQAKYFVTNSVGNKKPSVNRIGAYQCCWYHFFRNDIYDNDISAKCFNFDDVTYYDGVNAVNYDVTEVRSVDDFIVDCLQLRYVPYKKDLFTGAMPGTQYGPVSAVNIDVTFEGLSASFTGDAVSIAPGVSTENNNHITSNNLFSSSGQQFSPSTGSDANRWTSSEQLAHNTKYFAGASRGSAGISLNAGEYGTANGSDVTYDGGTPLEHTHVLANHAHTITPVAYTPTGVVNLSGTPSSTSLFDVLSLVEAQAIQKWRQKSMLAGNKTADQFRAHHGVVPRHLIDHLPDFIGSVDNVINVTEITSQADTATQADESNLGEIRGRGYGASDARSFTFKSDDYGILLLIHAIVPENTYNSFGIEKGNTMITYTDFYQAEYQNIGLEAVPRYLLAMDNHDTPASQTGGAEGGDSFPARNTGVLGYAPRYFGYKQYQSKVHGMFNSSRISGTTIPYRFGYADMQSFVMPRRDFDQLWYASSGGTYTMTTFSMNRSKLYVNPHIFDSIFAIEASNSETTDEFFSHVNFYCHASLPMSVLGLPQF